MRLVATSDTHTFLDPSAVPDGDVFIHAGDFMLSGYVTEWNKCVDSFRELPHKTKIVVAGNHDIHMGVYAGSALWDLRNAGVYVLGLPTDRDTVTLLHDGTLTSGRGDGYRLLGLPMVHNLPRWAFNFSEDFLDDYMDHCKRADIVISHCPPAGILDAGYGIKAYRKYLEEYEPMAWICGHIHEHGGEHKRVHKTDVYNVAAMNRHYEMTHSPRILDL